VTCPRPTSRTAVLAALLLAACGGGGTTTTPPPPPPPPPPTLETLTIQGLPASFEVGQQVQLSVVARSANGTVVSNPALFWSSTSPAVVSVSSAGGRITAVSPGQATIRVTGGGKQAEAALNVTPPTATVVSLVPATVALAPGGNAQLQSAVLGANGTIPGLTVLFSTADPAVAAIDASGKVTAVGPGRTTVTARYGNLTQSSGVTVSNVTQNVRLAQLDIIQVAQTSAADVPVVQGKPSAVRVYAVATQPGAVDVPIDVRVERNGTTVFSQRISSGSIPTAHTPLLDGAARYVPLPIGLDLDGVTLSARIDPDDATAEADEWDNDLPTFRETPVVRTSLNLPQIRVRLVPMAPPGQPLPTVSPSLAAQLVTFMNLIYPTVGVHVEVGGGIVTSADWESTFGVTNALNQLNAQRIEDGSIAYYYGVTAPTPINGAAGWGRNPGTVSMGWPDPEIVAHEVGHNFGLSHPVGCGNGTPGAPGAVIGLPGYDPRTLAEVPSSAVSVMSYCTGYVWIQPTSYLAILNNRRAASGLRAEPTITRQAVVVMGQVHSGRATIDAVRTSRAPRGISGNAGPVRVRLLDDAGTELMDWHLASERLSTETSDADPGSGYAGVIPVPDHLASRVRRIAVSNGGVETSTGFRLAPGY
jgi:hypothetical protein